MSRARKQDCWQASVRISIPIDATKPETIAQAQQSVRELAALIPGSSVEVTHAGFGRMAVGAMTPLEQHQAQMAQREPVTERPDLLPFNPGVTVVTGTAPLRNGPVDDGLDIPEHLRRV